MGTAGASAEGVKVSAPKGVWSDLPWYFSYCLYHLFLFPVLAFVGLCRFHREKLKGIGWARLRGGTAPPHPARWVVFVAGALGEARTATSAGMALKDAHPVAVWLQQAQPYRAIRKRVGDTLPVGLAPLNNPFSALIALLRWRPKALVFIEQTSNLHLVMLARMLGVKVVIANVSLTEYRAGKYRRRPFGPKRFKMADLVLAVGEEHRQRLLDLGVHPDRILVTGPPVPPPPKEQDRERWSTEWRQRFGIRNGEPVIVAGSTYPEEEGVLLEAFRRVKQVAPDAKLVLAPRHTSREDLDQVVRQSGLEYELRSRLNGEPAQADVILLDTQGELSHVWGTATVAFVGGSLMRRGPGHSPLEPLSWCVPVTMGPSFEQQTAAVNLCKEWGIVQICADPAVLAETWLAASQNQEYRRAFSERCEEFLTHGSKVYERWWQAICDE
ncbi:MAG: hypothetical protein KatS3mg015_1309 [Fimbriimonadales bacterium]|nr:MAG: hypothetical protein KatS3mg015_1309 [Fimbriimonadales bacterium]